jgi:hypothetical protein
LGRTFLINVFTVDSDAIQRSPEGFPQINGSTHQARLFLATASEDGGWLLETWRQDHAADPPRRQVKMHPDTDSLAADIGRALRAVAANDDD